MREREFSDICPIYGNYAKIEVEIFPFKDTMSKLETTQEKFDFNNDFKRVYKTCDKRFHYISRGLNLHDKAYSKCPQFMVDRECLNFGESREKR